MFKKVARQLELQTIENNILKLWEREDYFHKLIEKNKGKKKFSFLDGPITANNPMGLHHAWGRTYKDIFQRYKAMQGFDQRFQNGFDCQGLWVEVEVEKELGFNSKKDIEKFGIAKFVEKCRERVHKYSKIQTRQSIRLGQWMDWGEYETSFDDKDWMKKSHSYYTMSEENNYLIWYFLKKCYENGWIYKGSDVMPWCIRCGTAITNMEISTEGYKEMSHKSITLKLPLINKQNEYLLVWTTTPWTLTSNTAVAIHPELTYVKVEQKDGIYYIIKNMITSLNGEYKIIEELKGEKLIGLSYKGPFDELPVQKGVGHKTIPWKEISEEEGTGLVHIAPGCGKEDLLLGRKYNLSIIAPLNEMGYYIEGFDWLTGKDVRKVAGLIEDNLVKKGILYKTEDYLHRYPVCWRCNNELVFRLVDEWYISMKDLRYKIMDATKEVKRWIPNFGLQRELDWLANMDDWCISKKRYWGLALPIWECKCGNFKVIGGKNELKKEAVDGWDKFNGHTPHKPWIDEIKVRCNKCGEKISRIADVGTPWLDAGIVPFSTIRKLENKCDPTKGYPFDKTYWREWFPADFITECFPGQFRNWFYAILTMSTVLENQPPFRILLGHASVRDEKGEEMHKSKGNAIWFDDAAEKTGADVLRWMFASHNPEDNLNFSYRTTKEIKRKLLTLWNTYSFFVTYANIDKFIPKEKTLNKENFTILDKWVLSKLHNLIKISQEEFDNYELPRITREVEVFIDDLSTWYLRCNRSRFWKSENDSDKETAFLVLYTVLLTIVKLIAPIMPFLSEEIYQNLSISVNEDSPQSVHLCDFPKYASDMIDDELEKAMKITRLITSLGRAVRNNAGIKVRQPLSEIKVKTAHPDVKISDDLKKLILKELNIKKFSEFESEVEKEKIKQTNDWIILSENNYFVAIKTVVSEELLKEGLSREFVHKVQIMRKEANFNITDRIYIHYKGTPILHKAINEYIEYIQNETLALQIKENNIPESTKKYSGEIFKTQKINKEETEIYLKKVFN